MHRGHREHEKHSEITRKTLRLSVPSVVSVVKRLKKVTLKPFCYFRISNRIQRSAKIVFRTMQKDCFCTPDFIQTSG